MSVESLQGRVILITGSSSGIGLATAEAALAQGAKVVIHGHDPEKVRHAAAAVGEAPFCVVDLASPDCGDRIVEAALQAHGRLDGLVNNAGIFPRGDLDATDAAFFDAIFAVNARAPLLVAKRAVAAFRAQRSPGTIVNIGSVNAYCGQPDLLAYSMSKGALMTMTRNLADALASERIRVNQLNVGWTLTETEIETQRREGRPDDWPQRIPPLFAPTGGILSPEMIARHVLFWSSDASAPVTGQVYEVEQYPFLGRTVMSRVI